MEEEIITKLESALSEPIGKECQVVYIMVEIRKLLDKKNDANYPLLRFYCDWCVHAKKDRITPVIKNMMEKIYREIQGKDAIKVGIASIISRKDSFGICRMDKLKEEMKSFFDNYTISNQLLNDKSWVSFVNTFVKILIDQRIENPCNGIEYFKFLAAEKTDYARFKISYKIKEAEYKKYEGEFPINKFSS